MRISFIPSMKTFYQPFTRNGLSKKVARDHAVKIGIQELKEGEYAFVAGAPEVRNEPD